MTKLIIVIALHNPQTYMKRILAMQQANGSALEMISDATLNKSGADSSIRVYDFIDELLNKEIYADVTDLTLFTDFNLGFSGENTDTLGPLKTRLENHSKIISKKISLQFAIDGSGGLDIVREGYAKIDANTAKKTYGKNIIEYVRSPSTSRNSTPRSTPTSTGKVIQKFTYPSIETDMRSPVQTGGQSPMETPSPFEDLSPMTPSSILSSPRKVRPSPSLSRAFSFGNPVLNMESVKEESPTDITPDSDDGSLTHSASEKNLSGKNRLQK